MALKDWKKTNDLKDYVTWRRLDSRVGNYNVFTLVAKVEQGEWVVFLDGQDAGVEVLSRHLLNRYEALAFAKKYMEGH